MKDLNEELERKEQEKAEKVTLETPKRFLNKYS